MDHPKLKHPTLCIAVLIAIPAAAIALPFLAASVAQAHGVPDAVTSVIFVIYCLALLAVIIATALPMFFSSLYLTSLRSSKKARKRYVLPKSWDPEKTARRISRFGKGYEPTPLLPRPDSLRYKSSYPLSRDCRGIERIAALYLADRLDKELFNSIVRSARANSDALKGKKTFRILDKRQRKSPLKRSTAAIILAKSVDQDLTDRLMSAVSDHPDERLKDESLLWCVVDQSAGTCVFDSLKIPYLDGVDAKTRCIRMITRLVFNGRLPLSRSPETITKHTVGEFDPEQTSLWRLLKELFLTSGWDRIVFRMMKDRQVRSVGDSLYVKVKGRGVSLRVFVDDENKTVTIYKPDTWEWPKSGAISDADAALVTELAGSFVAELGYTLVFSPHTRYQ